MRKFMGLMAILVYLAASFFVPSPVYASGYNSIIYVSTNGSDTTGNGSQLSPYASIPKAFSMVNTNNTEIYIETPGTYNIPNGLESILSPAYSITYQVNPNYYGSVIFNLQNTEQNEDIVMTQLDQFIGVIFTLSGEGFYDGGRVYEYFFNGATIDLQFYNCVFNTGTITPSAQPLFTGNSSGCKVLELNFVNCDFIPNGWSGFYSNISKMAFVNCAFASNISSWAGAISSYSLLGATFGSNFNITSQGWKNTGTGTNPDGTVANIGVYGGTYAWGYNVNSMINPSIQQSVSNNTVTLSWTDNDYSTIQVFCNNNLVATIPGTQMQYQTGYLPNGLYSFFIEAFNQFGVGVSNMVTVNLMGDLTGNLELSEAPGGNQVILGWNLVSNATGYEVIDNGLVVANLSSLTSTYSFTPNYTGNNLIYVQVTLLSGGYIASNIVNCNYVNTPNGNSFLMYATNGSGGLIKDLNGKIDNLLHNNMQNVLAYEQVSGIVASHS